MRAVEVVSLVALIVILSVIVLGALDLICYVIAAIIAGPDVDVWPGSGFYALYRALSGGNR